FFQAEDGIRDFHVTGVQTCALPILIEFVPADTVFKLEMNLQIYDEDNENEMLNFVKRALKSLEETYIGGMGSRGYGQIRLRNLRSEERRVGKECKDRVDEGD